MQKKLEYLHDVAPKPVTIPAGHIAVVQGSDGDAQVIPWPPHKEIVREPFSMDVDGHERIAVLAPGKTVIVDCPDEFKIPEGMCGCAYRRIAIENRDGIGHERLVGRYVFDGRGWMGWADEEQWIDDTGTRIPVPTQPEATRTLAYVHDHAAKCVLLPPGNYLISQTGCCHPYVYPDPFAIKLELGVYWKDGKQEEGIAYFGARVAILKPGDEITVCSDRTLIGYVRPEEYREERFRNINGRIERTVLQRYVVR